jgi:hypothetical protein
VALAARVDMKLTLLLAAVLLLPATAQAQQPTSSPKYELCAMVEPPTPEPLTCEKPWTQLGGSNPTGPRCGTRCKIRRARKACAWGQRRACSRYAKLLGARCKCGRCVVKVKRG